MNFALTTVDPEDASAKVNRSTLWGSEEVRA
jgi:hypothetical protein